jgi:hypothetical protein
MPSENYRGQFEPLREKVAQIEKEDEGPDRDSNE